jgi:hypothetical protein
MNHILTLFTAFTTPIYWGIADRKFPKWEIARARIVTEISTVSCLAALQCCYQLGCLQHENGGYSMYFVSLEDRLHFL